MRVVDDAHAVRLGIAHPQRDATDVAPPLGVVPERR